jgi:tRNA threonylcarbamoyladenosine biosynthesis protein TsaB
VRILAIDTATENCSAALLIDGRLSTRERLLEHGHAELILPMADELLAEAGVSLRSLSAIAFGRGPGAFTGVRLAASVAQGLAFGAGLPVVPVSDLQALAQRALETDAAIFRVLACTDARMGEVYWGCFERGAADLAALVGEEHVGKPESVSLPDAWTRQAHADAMGSVSGPPGVTLCGVGSGFTAYPQLRAAIAGSGRVLEGVFPRACEIARLAAPEAAAARALPAEQALPVYLRDDVPHGRPGSVIKLTPSGKLS